jgi:hypothetical protein
MRGTYSMPSSRHQPSCLAGDVHHVFVVCSCRDVAISDRALVQKIACVYWVGHYAKRIAETFLVHT